MIEAPEEFWIVALKDGDRAFYVDEQTALSVVARLNGGVQVIEFDSMGGSRVFVPRENIADVASCTRESRDFSRACVKQQQKEEQAFGNFE